jgi:DNA-binding CsgD family transcriptional regulator
MTQTLGKSDKSEISGGQLAAANHHPLLYLDRIAALIVDLSRPDFQSTKPLFLLIPPGMDGELLCVTLLESLNYSFDVFDHGDDVYKRLDRACQDSSSTHALIAYPELLASSDLDAIFTLATSATAKRFIFVTYRPVWLALPDSKILDCDVIGPRAFRYSESEFQSLIERSASCDNETDASRTDFDPVNLFDLTQGWPLISECAISDVYTPSSGRAEYRAADKLRTFSLAQLGAVKNQFVSQWLPLLESRYRWLIEVTTLPLLNLDLLKALFDEPVDTVPECLMLGWLEPCSKNSGFYQINTALDVLLLSVHHQFENRDVLERAAKWYRQHGYLSEAMECLVSFVDNEQLLEILSDPDSSKPADDLDESALQTTATTGSLGSASRIAKGSLKLSRSDSRARWARAVLGSVATSKAASAGEVPDRVASSVDPLTQQEIPGDPAMQLKIAGVLDHIATAFEHHRSNNAEALSSALAQAVDAGIDRQYLTQVMDFVDLHIRPLLRNEGSPLQMAIRDLKHSAPAREAIATQYKQLNHRELQVLQRICEGYKNKEISEQLGLELSTIKWYSTGIYEKLQVRNRTQAVAKAQALKLFG